MEYEPDFDAILKQFGVGNYRPAQEWYDVPCLSYTMIKKGLSIGAITYKPLGPRGGAWYAITNEERWGRMKVWRALLSLGVRGVRDAELRK